ncbi:hypothetical protein [Mucilaginibacter puniceus]
MNIFKNVFSYILFLAVLAAPPLWLSKNGHTDLLVPHFWLIFFFLSGLTLIVVITVMLGQQINGERGAQFFLAATTFKILACLVFALVFLLKNKVNKYVFVADFFYIYLLNTVFEIYTLLRNLRNQNLK